MDNLIGQVLLSRFEVDSLIGEGRMGMVFSATDDLLGRKVAIKVLRDEFASDTKFLERFQREARIIAQLSSNPHVVTIYDIGKTDMGLPFLVTEYLNGHPLSQEMAHGPRPSRSWVLDIGIQVCYALAEAHSKGVIHRDLKPANLFVMKAASLPMLIKVLDFGLSRSEHTPLSPEVATQPGVPIGTPKYMAPEVLAGDGAKCASDIYSLGLIVYELATGAYPYDATNSAHVLRAHLTQHPAEFPEEPVSFPGAFRDLVFAMLEKEPSKRPEARECLREFSRTDREIHRSKPL